MLSLMYFLTYMRSRECRIVVLVLLLISTPLSASKHAQERIEGNFIVLDGTVVIYQKHVAIEEAGRHTIS